VEAVVGPTALQAQQLQAVRPPLLSAAQSAGQGSQTILTRHGLAARFNAVHPNVVNYARSQAAELVVAVPQETKRVIAEVIALGAEHGLTTVQQARAIREVVGLPPGWAQAPMNLSQEIRAGRARAATSRRLSAVTKQQIRSRIAAGTVTEAFVQDVSAEYAASLVNRRAQNIARTESLRAANHGLTESWRQARAEGVLPETARRFWIVTPDDRLRPSHAQIPKLNARGRELDEPFLLADGRRVQHPPADPNCRCSVGLLLQPPEEEDEETPEAQAAPATVAPAELPDSEVLALPPDAYPVLQESEETLGRYYNNGAFSPERQRLHDAIVRQHFQNVTPVPEGVQPVARVMGGGPASGKSSMLAKIETPNHVVVDPDHIKTLLPEYRQATAAGLKNAAVMVHEESSLLAKRITREATKGRYNVLIDGTGDNSYENLAQKVAGYRAHGHKVIANYVTIDTDEAMARMLKRAQRSGRYVPESYLREVHRNISHIVPRAMREGLFDELTVWDNNAKEIKAIVRHTARRTVVLDEAAWQQTLAKAQDSVLLSDAFPKLQGQRLAAALGGPHVDAEAWHNYLGAYGKEWKAAPLPAGIPKMPPKACYENASKLVMQLPELRYVEGIAYSSETGGLPFAHAWAVTPEGAVIDATWSNPAGARYFGVAYDREKYLKYVVKRKYYGVVGGDVEGARQAIRKGAYNLRQAEVRATARRPQPVVSPGPAFPDPVAPPQIPVRRLSRLNPDEKARRQVMRHAQEVEERQRLRALPVEERAKAIARKHDVPEQAVVVERGAVPDIDIGGKNHGPRAGFYDPATQTVHVHEDMGDIGLIAHETQHYKFDRVMRAFDREWEEIRALELANPSGTGRVIFPDDLLRPEFRSRYPTVAALERYLHGYYTRGGRTTGRFVDPVTAFAREDGVSHYSREYFEAWQAGTLGNLHRGKFLGWVNETLAEMARDEQIGAFRGQLQYRQKKHLVGFYRAIQKEHKRIARLERGGVRRRT
jgi:hypothetical protein